MDTTIIINKSHFSIQTKEFNHESVLLIINKEGKNISVDTLENAIFEIEILDFNKDKYPDIFFSYVGNNLTSFLYLFNPHTKRFKNVEDFLDYPDALPVKSSPNLYYSYHRAGCADLIWVSDLFKIENYKAVHLGQIYGDACQAEPGEESFYIKIYKVISRQTDGLKLIQKLSHSVTSRYKDIKWGFIKHYWNSNFKKFI
jgi:hypothetical protein